MPPRELVSTNREIRLNPFTLSEKWPERMVYRGSSWNAFSGCLVVLISPGIGLFLLVVVAAVTEFVTGELPGNQVANQGVFATCLLLPPIAALIWWIRNSVAVRKRSSFEVAFVPKTIPALIGQPFKARFEVRMPDEPTEFHVVLQRLPIRKHDATAWRGKLSVTAPQFQSTAPDRYAFDIEIPVSNVTKAPGRDWEIAFEARSSRNSTYYLAWFSVRMNEDEP